MKRLYQEKWYYCQLKQSYKAAKTESGSENFDVKKPVWLFCDSFYFLNGNVNPRDTICNISTEVLSPESVSKKRSKKGRGGFRISQVNRDN